MSEYSPGRDCEACPLCHELFMSIYMPLMQGMQGLFGQASQSQQMHGGPAPESEMQPQMHGGPAPESEMQDTGPQTMQQMGIIGNNMLGSPAGVAAGGLAAVVVYSVIPLAAAAFVVSRRQRSRRRVSKRQGL